jgi:hypothetical protein
MKTVKTEIKADNNELVGYTAKLQTVVTAVDDSYIAIKAHKKLISDGKEDVLSYITKLLKVDTETIEKENPLFAGTNIKYLYLQSKLAHVEVQDNHTTKMINLILWAVSIGINAVNFSSNYKELEMLKKYFANLVWDTNTSKETLTMQLNNVIKFEGIINNYMNEKSVYPTPATARKCEELKPLWASLKEGKKLKSFDFATIHTYLTKYEEVTRAI